LRGHTTALDAYANVEGCEFVLAEDEDWLVDLEAKAGGFNVLNGLTIDFDEATALFGIGAGGGGLLPARIGRKRESEGVYLTGNTLMVCRLSAWIKSMSHQQHHP